MKLLTNLIVVAVCVVILSAQMVLAGPAEDKAKLYKDISVQIDKSASASPQVQSFVKAMLLPLSGNPVFVKAVAEQNASGKTLDDIKQTDEQWINAEDELPIHKVLLTNPCSKEIKRIVKNMPVIVEAFVMDNQGANVAQNTLTSDYWQGDEGKWQNSYNGGKGGVEISGVEFDKSANAQLQQVSLPVIDDNGQVIGAVCYGINTAYAEIIGKVAEDIDSSAIATDDVKRFAKYRLLGLSMNSIFVSETTAQNDKSILLDEVKNFDRQWMEAEDELPLHKEKLGNPCAQEIRRLASRLPAILEAFVMDNQGANVGQNALTSDYWQGDEAKWQKSFNGGKGGVEIGVVEFDKSANVQLQQISLPVIDAKGSVIGAVCYGINTDQVGAFQVADYSDILPQ